MSSIWRRLKALGGHKSKDSAHSIAQPPVMIESPMELELKAARMQTDQLIHQMAQSDADKRRLEYDLNQTRMANNNLSDQLNAAKANAHALEKQLQSFSLEHVDHRETKELTALLKAFADGQARISAALASRLEKKETEARCC